MKIEFDYLDVRVNGTYFNFPIEFNGEAILGKGLKYPLALL